MIKNKCWSSQFMVFLWDPNLGKQYLLSPFLQKRSLLHPSHLQKGRKGIKKRGPIRVVRMKMLYQQSIFQVHHCPIWLCSPDPHWAKGFSLEVYSPSEVYHWKILEKTAFWKWNIVNKTNLSWSSLWFISWTRDISSGKKKKGIISFTTC